MDHSCNGECRDEQLSFELGLAAATLGMTDIFISYAREGRVQLGRQQQVIMRVLLDKSTIDYMVRLEGAVDFSSAQTPPK